MADVSKININGTGYDLKDSTARTNLETIAAETETIKIQKFDAENIESGTGTLSVVDDAATEFIQSAEFQYNKIDKTVNIIVKIVFNAGTLPTGGFVRFSGLPYKTGTMSTYLKTAVSTDQNRQFTARLYGSWLSVTTSTPEVVQDESLVFSAVYMID